MSKIHSNISVFVPHIGCKHNCSFCNQFSITGNTYAPDENDIDSAVFAAKKSPNYNPQTTELAFFGGSFTAIDTAYQERLLKAAHKYILSGDICGIRISTRPDAINDENLKMLKNYGVSAIELGAQSMVDSVLKANNRGHSAEDVYTASKQIKQYGFSLGLQMMTDLYTDNDDGALYTAREIIAINPDTVRIYPTIVLKHTHLEHLVKSGEYKPQELSAAVNLVAKLLLMFKAANINVIRTGLHTIDEKDYIAGPWHPAFKELCDTVIYRNLVLEHKAGDYTVYVPQNAVSKMIGQKRENILTLKEMGYNCCVKADTTLNEYEIRMCNNKCC